MAATFDANEQPRAQAELFEDRHDGDRVGGRQDDAQHVARHVTPRVRRAAVRASRSIKDRCGERIEAAAPGHHKQVDKVHTTYLCPKPFLLISINKAYHFISFYII